MSIAFGPERWERVRRVYGEWWRGELARPIVPVELLGRDPGQPRPAAPLLSQETCADLSVPVEDLVDRLDWELSSREFLGDAFPCVRLDSFGPGIAAAFMGARLDNLSGRVWFLPPAAQPIEAIHFRYDADNVWLRRIKALCRAAMARWQGQVLVTMPDLGGNLDLLSTFRPSEALPMDLYDRPDEVRRLLWEAHDLWHRFYRELNDVLQPLNPGYSDWSAIYSDTPSYMLQCDFAYMISPAMFDAFVRPELEASVRRLSRSFYHLDGRGQLPHLGSVLSIERLGGVQWVPGAGAPDTRHWPEVYGRIAAAGKKAQVWDGLDALDAVIAQTGRAGMFHHGILTAPRADESLVRRRLAGYGIEA